MVGEKGIRKKEFHQKLHKKRKKYVVNAKIELSYAGKLFALSDRCQANGIYNANIITRAGQGALERKVSCEGKKAFSTAE